jgi:molecular chaperone GrpE (heat shock protein)
LERTQAAIDEDLTKIKLKVDLLNEGLATEKRANADLNVRIGELQQEIEGIKQQAQKDIAQAKANASEHALQYFLNDANVKSSVQRMRKGAAPSNQAVHQFFINAGLMEDVGGKWRFTDAGNVFAEKFPR